MDYSYHSLILLVGITVAGLALFSAIAVGPYGRRGVRPLMMLVSFCAAIGSGYYFFTYLGLIEQRRAIETRFSELRTQAMNASSTLACLDYNGDVIDNACGQKVFAAPETLAAANSYTAAMLDLLTSAARYSGPRTPQFNDAVVSLERFLQQDSFGFTANLLTVREGCTAERCAATALLKDPSRVMSNIRAKTFEANVARYAAAWRPPSSISPTAAAPASSGATLLSSETRAPIPDKYVLPSAASIPPVSIMNDEPAERTVNAPARKDRPATAAQPPAAAPNEQPSETAPVKLPAASAQAPEKQAPARRRKSQPNAPLSITPTQ